MDKRIERTIAEHELAHPVMGNIFLVFMFHSPLTCTIEKGDKMTHLCPSYMKHRIQIYASFTYP